MSLENFGSMLETQDEVPKLKEASKEDILKVEESIKYSNKLTKVNNVLSVLDFPDDTEEIYRKTLEKQDNKKLIELAWKSKIKILKFLINSRKNDLEGETIKTHEVIKEENVEQSKENEIINSKVSKIKSIFTSEILNNNPDIAQKLNEFDSLTKPLEKEAELKDILWILKQPWKLESIISTIWWANKNNPQYLEFRNNLIWIESSFENYFNKLENKSFEWLNSNDVIKEIENESWWLETIDFKSDNPVSKLNLEWSSYSFDKKIDKESFWELMSQSKNKIEEVQSSVTTLKGLYSPLDNLLNQIRVNWWKEGFKEKLNTQVSLFPNDVFWDLNKVYETMNIKLEDRINLSDINSFKDINSPDDLRNKIENIKQKISNINSQIKEVHAWILKEHKLWLKELIQRNSEEKERQVEVLKFMKASWFDLIPKNITNRIIEQIQANQLNIPWLDLNKSNIDLENWHFGECWAFTSNEKWLNIESKENMLKFMNKLISWNIDWPLNVKAIKNWTSIANESFMKNEFLEAWIVSGLDWKYSKIIENLKKKNS